MTAQNVQPITDQGYFNLIAEFFNGDYDSDRERDDLELIIEDRAQKMGFTLETIDRQKYNGAKAYEAYKDGPESFETYLQTCFKSNGA